MATPLRNYYRNVSRVALLLHIGHRRAFPGLVAFLDWLLVEPAVYMLVVRVVTEQAVRVQAWTAQVVLVVVVQTVVVQVALYAV